MPQNTPDTLIDAGLYDSIPAPGTIVYLAIDNTAECTDPARIDTAAVIVGLDDGTRGCIYLNDLHRDDCHKCRCLSAAGTSLFRTQIAALRASVIDDRKYHTEQLDAINAFEAKLSGL